MAKYIKNATALFIALLLMAFLNSCVTGNCTNTPQRPSPEPSPSPSAMAEPAPPEPEKPKTINEIKRLPSIEVFKNTGEQQCGLSKGVTLDDMQMTLTKKKIPVYESRTQQDGLMHIAVCGSPTGTIHVFTVPKIYLKRALRMGFKVLTDSH